MKVAVPVLEVKGELRINPHFGKSDWFAIVDLETNSVEKVENPAMHLERGRGVFIAEMFSKKGVKAVLVKEIGPGAFEKVKSKGIEIFLVPMNVKKLEEGLNLFREGKLQPLEEPNEK